MVPYSPSSTVSTGSTSRDKVLEEQHLPSQPRPCFPCYRALLQPVPGERDSQLTCPCCYGGRAGVVMAHRHLCF